MPCVGWVLGVTPIARLTGLLLGRGLPAHG